MTASGLTPIPGLFSGPASGPSTPPAEQPLWEGRKPPQPYRPATDRPTAADDRRLVRRLLERDSEAWSEFLGLYRRLIIKRVLSACDEVRSDPHADVVDECCSEIILALFRNDMAGLRRFEGRSRLSTWLAVVARRVAIAYLLRRRRDTRTTRQPDSRFDIALVPDAGRDDPSENDSEEQARLQLCLQQLSDGDRRVLALSFEQQLSYEEIGAILGISANAVGPKLNRARKRLRKLMIRDRANPSS